jgi:hypothetical protein
MIPYRITANASNRKVCDDVFILNRDTGNIHTLSETGNVVWELMKKEASPDDIVSAITAEYDVDRATAERDVSAFLEKLEKKGFAARNA